MAGKVYSLFEFDNLECVYLPIRGTARVKYTCFDVSRSYLIFGANSGSLYFFQRNPVQYICVLSNKEGAVSMLAVAPDEKYLAFASSKGNIVLLQHNVGSGLNERINVSPAASPRYMQVKQDLVGATVTSLKWDSNGDRLFVGDSQGKVVCVSVALKKSNPFFKIKTSMVVVLDSLVFQMDFCQEKLLISTQTGCYFCDTSKEQYSQIGSKPRIGDFGACFYNNSRQSTPKIYAARPGSRFWEIDFEGSVLCTHQFKKALAIPPVPLVSLGEQFCAPDLNSKFDPQVLNFQKLTVIGERFILTSAKEKLLIFDPVSMSVLLWSTYTRDIIQSKVFSSQLYLWDREGKLRNLQMAKVEEGIESLLTRTLWKLPICTTPLILAAKLCLFYRSAIIASSARNILPRVKLEELTINLQSSGEQALAKDLNQLLEELEEMPLLPQSPPEVRVSANYLIESGIYIVNRPNSTTTPAKKARQIGTKVKFAELDNEQNAGSSSGTALLEVDSRRHNLTLDQNNGAKGVPTGNAVSMQPSSDNHASDSYTESSSQLENIYYGTPMSLSFVEPYVWPGSLFDLDPSLVATLNPGAALDELKNSISSKYGSGKKRIKNTIGVLGGHIKALAADDSPEPFDVQIDQVIPNDTSSDPDFYFEDHQGEEILFTTKLKNGKFVQSSELYGPLGTVDTAELLEATEQTWREALDHRVFCNIDKLKATLEKWVEALIDTQELTYRAMWTSACSTCKGATESPRMPAKLGISRSCQSLSVLETTATSSEEQTSLADWKKGDSNRVDAAESSDFEYSRQSSNDALNDDIIRQTPKIRLMCVVRSRSMDRLVQMENVDSPVKYLESGDAGYFPCSRKRTLLKFTKFEDCLRRQEAAFAVTNCSARLIEITPQDKCWLCYPQFFLVDPWRLNVETQKRVSRLATMCVKTRVFGKIAQFCKEQAVDATVGDVDSVSQSVSDSSNWTFDRARSIFVRQFFHLLDYQAVFLDMRSETGSTFRTWTAILGGLLGHLRHAVPLASLIDVQAPILKTLLVVARCRSQDFPHVAESVLKSFEAISYRDVLYLTRIREGPEYAELFLNLVERLCAALPSKPTSDQEKGRLFSIEKICCDPVVYLNLVETIFQLSPKPPRSETKCCCGNLKQWSYNTHFSRINLLLNILKFTSLHQKYFLQLCEDYGFWPGYLHLLLDPSESRQNIFKSLVQLSDIDLMRDPANIRLLPQDVGEWKEMLELVIRQQKQREILRNCVFCEATLQNSQPVVDLAMESQFSFETVARIFIKYSEVDLATAVIFDLVKLHPDMRLSSDFYRYLLLSASAKWQQRNLAYNLLEKIDAYVWSRNKNLSSPQVFFQVQKELRTESCKQECVDRRRGLTDLHCHWGSTVDLRSNCSICTYSLATRIVSNGQGGVRVFPCGHGFHFRCAQVATSCSICS